MQSICLHCNKILEPKGECNCDKTIKYGKRVLYGRLKMNEKKATCECDNMIFEPLENATYLQYDEIFTLFRCVKCGSVVGKIEKNK